MFDKEKFFISQFDTKYIGDDGAIVGEQIYSKDLFAQDIHFRLSWMSLYDIACKAMLINISDALSMNAQVKYALIGLKLPKYFKKPELIELYHGFRDTATEYNFEIIGGDTISGDKLDISITLISTSKNPVLRKGLKQRHLLAYTGTIGNVKPDLKKLLQNRQIPSNSKFIKPILKNKFMQKANKYMSSAMDISDGLCFELERLSHINRCGFKFLHPISDNQLSSGEEYELLFSFDKKHYHILQNIAKQTKTPITIFAKANRGRYIHKFKNHHH